MATLITNADGNLTGASTFCAAEAGALSNVLIRNNFTNLLAAGTVTSVTFTVTNAKVIDGVMLWLKMTAGTPTGTFKVDLQKGGVSQASVTVNKTDLPDSTSATYPPVFFKFTGTATGDGGSNWTLVLTTTGTIVTSIMVTSATITSYTRALRTTTAATPAAGDDLYILGELTGAGTKNVRAVTMNSTAATVYGNGTLNTTGVAGGTVAIGYYATLAYANSASTNYILRVAGDLIVYAGGRLDMGVAGPAGGDPYWSSVKLLMGFEGADAATGAPGMADESSSARGTATVVDNAQIDTAQKPFGTSSLLLDGSGDYITFPDSTDWELTGPFTIELQVRLNALPFYQALLHHGADVTFYAWWFAVNSVGEVRFDLDPGMDGSPDHVITSGLSLLTTGVWYTLCAERDATDKIRLYINGVMVGSKTGATGASGNAAATLKIGAAGGYQTNGWLKELRITKGVARYASDSGYTPVTSAFPRFAGGTEIPRNSTAVLEFQPVSADGDFGLRILDNATCNIAGLSRTSGKNVVACKLTADVVSANVLSVGITVTGGTSVSALEATGNSLLAGAFTDNTTNTQHYITNSSPGITNTTQTGSVWLARGSGLNNRYVRVMISDGGPTPSNGCYTDVDLQAGTVGTATTIGAGLGVSAAITPSGTGYVVRLTGRASSVSSNPRLLVIACSAAGTVTYAGNTTQCFLYDHNVLVTTSSISDTTFNVDTDTGWLNGDAICVASTSRAVGGVDTEIFPLNANAGSSSMTSALYPGSSNSSPTHLGTAPRQAEVILLTRNVKVQSTSTTLMSYVYAAALATVNFSWAEFRWIGTNVGTKRGIEIDGGAVANAKSITYCSIHDTEFSAFQCQALVGVVSLNVTFSNNVFWSCGGAVAAGTITGTVATPNWTFDSNIMVRTSGGWSLLDIGGTFTNNTVAGSYSTSVAAFTINEGGAAIGTFSNNTAHSGAYYGMVVAGDGCYGTITNFKAWRNNAQGLFFNNAIYDVVFDGAILFGNAVQNMIMMADCDPFIKNSVINGDPTTATSIGIQINGGIMSMLRLDNVDFSATAVGGGGAATGTDIHTQSSGLSPSQVMARNCKFDGAVANNKDRWTSNAFQSYEKYNQTAGDHRTELKYGGLKTDTAVFNMASPSMRMTPNDAVYKLQSAPLYKGIQCAVNSGSPITVNVYVRKDATYNGNQPRLIVRANPAVGINADTVLATYAASTGAWNVLTGTTIAATDDGVMEFIVDCDGTIGWVNVDDWSFA